MSHAVAYSHAPANDFADFRRDKDGYRPRRIDEVPPFRLKLKVIGFGDMTEMPVC
jgi:hypothetical protein